MFSDLFKEKRTYILYLGILNFAYLSLPKSASKLGLKALS